MLRRAKLALFAVLGIALAISSLVYANSTSIETGGTQVLPRISLTQPNDGIHPAVGLQDGAYLSWSPTGKTSGSFLSCNSATANCTLQSSYLNMSGNTFYFNGILAQSGNSRAHLGNSQAGLNSAITTNTGANQLGILMGTTVADGTAGIAGTTLLDVGTGVIAGTSNAAGNGSVANSKFNINGAGTSTFTAANGVNAIALATNGSRVDLGSAVSDYLYSDGVGIATPSYFSSGGPVYAATFVSAATFAATNEIKLTSQAANGTANQAYTDTNGVISSGNLFAWKNNGTTKAYVGNDGYVASLTPDTVMNVSTGLGAGTLLATGTVYAGRKITNPFTVTNVSMYVSVASSATASANQVITITDGTNFCVSTFACDTVTNTTGVKDVATTNGPGAGCVFPANALLTFSTVTQGCGTAATVKNIDIIGKWQ